MASNTPNLNLYKKDPVADGNDTFNVDTMLNQNWDKVDGLAGTGRTTETVKQNADDLIAHLADTAQDDDVHGLKTLFSGQQFANLLKNGDFASWSAGDTVFPDKWINNGAVTVSRQAGGTYGNNFARLVSGVSGSVGMVQNFSNYSIFAGKTLTLVARVRASATNTGRQALSINDGNSHLSSIIPKDGAWHVISVTVTVSASLSILGIYAYVNLDAISGDTLDVDWMMLVEGELPVMFANHPQDYVDMHANSKAPHPNIPAARVYHNADQSVVNDTNTILAFNSERFDNDNMHDIAVNNSRLVCQTAGKYKIIANVQFAGNITGYRVLSLLVNGTTTIGYVRIQALSNAADTAGLIVSSLWDLNVGDYVEVVAKQNSGGALSIKYILGSSPEFMMIREG